jgi:hypothetical protein
MGQKDRTTESVPRTSIDPRVHNTNECNNKSSKPRETHSTSLKCLFTNPDMLDNKMAELLSYVNEYKPLIIGVAEVKPKHYRYAPDTTTYDVFQGYKMYQKNINEKKGRGVLLYVHKSLNPEQVHVFEDYEESVWAEVSLVNQDKLLVGVVYRSGSGSDENNRLMMTMMRELSQTSYSHKLIMGDFNFTDIDWAEWSTPHNEDHLEFTFLECARDTFLHQHVTKPTRGRNGQNPSTLDLIFTTEEGMLSHLEHLSPLGKSDHCVLTFDFNCYVEFESKYKVHRFYDKGDYENMEKDLDLDWDLKFNRVKDDADAQWSEFCNILKEAEDKWIPKKIFSGAPRWKEYGKVPLEASNLKKIRKKHRCWQRFLETREGTKWNEYCRQRNQVRNISRKILRSTERDIAKEAKKNPKKFWSYVHSKTKTRSGISQLQTTETGDDGKPVMTKNDVGKAQVLLQQFSSVFTQEPPGTIPTLPEREFDHPLSTIELTEDMIVKKLTKLHIAKSPGPDAIHPRLLKELATTVARPLLIIFSTSLRTGKLPKDWKLAHISAIFKKGSRSLVNNYRPISLTCICCKVLESIIRDHLISHMKANMLFSLRQYGFITGRSTTLQLLKVLDKWTEILDKGGQVDVIYMDFMKAFDQVPHKRMINKLYSYGIRGDVLEWIRDFLFERSHRVGVNGSFSDWASVISGIPQGSVLGPILFVIYINDLPDMLNSECYLFADDTKLFNEINSKRDQELLQQDLNTLHEWSKKWLLNFHPDKCKVLSICLSKIISKHVYKLKCGDDVHELENVDRIKDLGVTVDSKLSFETHIHEKVSKANVMAGIIRRNFTFLDEDMFKCLYKSHVRPHLEYANSAWQSHKLKHIDALENVQRRATRYLPALKGLSYIERLRKLHMPTLTYRRARGDMIEVFKILNVYDRDVSPKLSLNVHPTRGHSFKLCKTRAQRDIRKYFFTLRVTDMWNSLPAAVVMADSLNSFKNRLDRAWSNLEFKYNYRAALPGQCRETRNYSDSIS